jgi:DNA-binding XRE family transcriptional regulator
MPRPHRVGDDLDLLIEQTTAERPEFEEMLEAAVRVRQLVRMLTDARERVGLTQVEVARRMGTTQPAVARFEAGDTDPRLSTVERYAQVVGLRLQPARELELA